MKAACLTIALLSQLLASCQTTTANRVAATLAAQTDPQQRQLLTEAISTLLHGSEVVLADDAFSYSSQLLIERRQLLGRDLATPEHFKLWLQGANCLLEHVESAQTKVLKTLNCIAE